jgi:NADH-quinone oxidoreductase subunit N
MISANDLMSLYMAVELQSLPLYVVAAMRTNSLRSSEAGLKYFLLGALSSGMLLYGASLVYGFAGTTAFDGIAAAVAGKALPVGFVVGLVFMISGLAFKVSAAPFHMWTPDVYEGSPSPVTALFAIAPKVAAIALMMRLTYGAFGAIADQWTQVLVALSIASMVVGALGAIMQSDIKRMMAYSSIAHMGYALAGLAAGSADGAFGVLIYMTGYIFMGAGTFAIILLMRRDGQAATRIADLQGLSRTHPVLALGLMVMMFSMAGIPPLAGFFGKWYVFLAAVNAGLVPLAVIGVVMSVIGAFYYLRIIKIMYFEEADEPLDSDLPLANRMVLGVSMAVILLFFVGLGHLFEQASGAAAALMAQL